MRRVAEFSGRSGVLIVAGRELSVVKVKLKVLLSAFGRWMLTDVWGNRKMGF